MVRGYNYSNELKVVEYESIKSVRVGEVNNERSGVWIANEFMVVDFIKTAIRKGCWRRTGNRSDI